MFIAVYVCKLSLCLQVCMEMLIGKHVFPTLEATPPGAALTEEAAKCSSDDVKPVRLKENVPPTSAGVLTYPLHAIAR